MIPKLDYCTKNNHKIFFMRHVKTENFENKMNEIERENIYILHINLITDILDFTYVSCDKVSVNKYIDEEKNELFVKEKENFVQRTFDKYHETKQNPDTNEKWKSKHIWENDSCEPNDICESNDICLINEICATNDTIEAQDERQKPDNRKNTTKTNLNREEIEHKVNIDKRFKFPEDLKEGFVIEMFLTKDEQKNEFLKRKESENYLNSRFKCDSCYKGFRENKLLEMHLIKHNISSGNYLCETCGIRLATSKQYRTHRDGNHKAKFSCKSCNFVTFSKAQARYHLSWHLGVEHKCPHCAMTFRKYTTLMGHIRIHHPSQYICGFCAYSFVSEHGLRHHTKLVHKNNKSKCKFINSEGIRCEDCDVMFVSKQIFTKHLLLSPKHGQIASTLIACKECGEQFDTKLLLSQHTHKNTTHAKDIKKNRFKCSHCDVSFSHPTSVYQHFIKSHPNMQYRSNRNRNSRLCELCGKTFMCQSKLLTHKMLHSGEKPYSCNECGKTFRTKLSLTKHTNLHQGVKLQCKVCGKQFSNAGNLFKHNRIHSGEKPFKCSLCSKAFVDSSNLKRHVQGVHYNVKRIRKK